MNDPIIRPDVDALVAPIRDGAVLAVPKSEAGVAMAATRALIRRGVKDLHLVCVPTSGLQADMMIGAGCVGTIECAGVTMAEHGPAPAFRRRRSPSPRSSPARKRRRSTACHDSAETVKNLALGATQCHNLEITEDW